MSGYSHSDFISGVCPRCGAPIDVNPALEAGVCQYCGTPYATNKAINKYNVVNNNIVNNINNSSNTYTVQYGRKGAVQSAFEYLDKRADARERAQAEDRERERILQEQKAERNRKIWRGVGQGLLWIYFFPIMLAIVLYKQSQQKKENEQRTAGGLAPVQTTPLPIVYIAIGAILFLSVVGRSISRDRAPAQETAESTKVEATTPKPSESSASANWYDQAPLTIKYCTFNEETVSESNGFLHYDVPSSWRKSPGEVTIHYYPYEDAANTFLWSYVEEFEFDFETATDTEINTFLEHFYTGLVSTDNFSDGTIKPCLINGRRAALISAAFSAPENGAAGTLYTCVIPAYNQLMAISVLMADSGKNITLDEFYACLNSIAIINE